MVSVYNFKMWDRLAGEFITSSMKRTAKDIDRLGAELISETVEMVDEFDLEDDGAYLPRAKKRPPSHSNHRRR